MVGFKVIFILFIHYQTDSVNKNKNISLQGPIETDSNDEVDGNGNLRMSRSKSFSIKSKSKSQSSISIKKHQNESESEDCDSATSSEAPDFDDLNDLPSQTSKSQSIETSEKRSIPEPGRGKIIFKASGEFDGNTCTLIGRDYPEDEHVLSKKDITTVIIKDEDAHFYLLLLTFRFNRKYRLVGKFTPIGSSCTAPAVTAFPSQLSTTN